MIIAKHRIFVTGENLNVVYSFLYRAGPTKSSLHGGSKLSEQQEEEWASDNRIGHSDRIRS